MPSTLPQPLNQSNPYEKIRDDETQIARMQFPQDMGLYYIAFQFAKYGPSYSSAASGLLSIPADYWNNVTSAVGIDARASSLRELGNTFGLGPIDAEIALPMPPNLVDDQQLDYNAQNLTNVAAAGITNLATKAIGAVSGQMAGQIASTAAGVAGSLMQYQSIFTGQAVNPFLAMMFTGPRFKTHQFGWRFSPKNESETDSIVAIVNSFKANALPEQWGAGGAVFAYPKVCLISLYPDKARTQMYKFKPAVIQQVSVNYAPSGTPAFFAGSNAPAEIELKIQLSEISVWTRNDFVQGPVGWIG